MARYKKLIRKTVNNNISSDLDNILKEAENITLDSLDFNKTFKEQGAILCDIKHLLSKNTRNTDNKPFACNSIISSKLNDKRFNELYQQFKIDLNNGVQLNDANNNVMTANQVSAFLNTLP